MITFNHKGQNVKMKRFLNKIKINGQLYSTHSDRRILGFGATLLPVVSISVLFASLLSSHTHAENTAFQVNVKESLSVSITSPATPASGNVGNFLRNKYTLDVSSNNTNGFTASMYAVKDTDLTNTSLNNQTIPTLASSSARGSFPVNRWGYSLGTSKVLNGNNYNETDAGNDDGIYHPIVNTSTSPITVLSSNTSGSGSQDIYFGAKADASKAAGDYSSTIVISVVSGIIDENNPITPTNPVGPNADNNVAKYMPSPQGGSNGATTYTYRRTSASAGATVATITTTQVSDGDNRSTYDGYTPPQGVREDTSSNINTASSSLAMGLATTAAVAAAAGMWFFIVAKRREDDDEDDVE